MHIARAVYKSYVHLVLYHWATYIPSPVLPILVSKPKSCLLLTQCVEDEKLSLFNNWAWEAGEGYYWQCSVLKNWVPRKGFYREGKSALSTGTMGRKLCAHFSSPCGKNIVINLDLLGLDTNISFLQVNLHRNLSALCWLMQRVKRTRRATHSDVIWKSPEVRVLEI